MVMKSLIIILLGLIITRYAPENDTEEYFYFGNTNLIGVGPTEEGKKFGTWRIYKRIETIDAPQVSLEAVRGTEVVELFDLSVPVYQINFKENLPDGLMEEFYPSGKIRKLANFLEGRLNGDFFEFNEKGDVLLSGSYFEDQKTGEWNSYYPNGIKASEFAYENGQLEGLTQNFYISGVLAEVLFMKSGKLEGLYQSFFPSGAIQKEVQFKNGKEHGHFKLYEEDEKTSVKGEFANGSLVGEWVFYDSDGSLLSTGTYLAGQKNGEWKERFEGVLGFYRTGSYSVGYKTGNWKVVDSAGYVYQEENYNLDQLIGISDFKTVKGNVLEVGQIKKGKGKRIIFDADGNRMENGRYANGKRAGIWYTYFPKTSLIASSGSYLAGEKVGTWKYYDLQGQLIREETINPNAQTDNREANSFENHLKKRQDFGRDLVSEPNGANDTNFLQRFHQPPNVGRFY